MKKTLLNLSMLLLFMIVGLGSAWAQSTWSVTQISGKIANNSITINNATWTLKDMTVGSNANGEPAMSISSQKLKFGNSKNQFWSSYTLSTDYFKDYNVTKVEIGCYDNGGTESEVTVIQGGVTIGSAAVSTTTSTNIETLDAAQGEGGTLNIMFTSTKQASYITSISVVYLGEESGGGDVDVVYHKVIWSVNGETTSEEVAEGDDIKFASPSAKEINGKTFVGWVSSPISGKQSTEPTYVNAAKMGDADVTYYAVYAKEQKGEVKEWKKITNKADITSGTYAIITFDSRYYLPNSPATGNAPTVASPHITNGKIDVTDEMKWKMSFSEAGNMNFESFSTAKSYLWGSNTNEGIRITETSGKSGASKDWEIKETADYGLVLYLPSVNRYLSTYNGQDWRNYSSTSTTNRAANLYKLVSDFTDFCTTVPEVLTITLNPACKDGEFVYSTFSSSLPFYVSGDIEVSEISILDDALYVESYKTGDIVPANTGVMVSAEEGGDYVVEIADAEMAELAESVLGDDNRLRPSGDTGITADKMAAADADCTYFRLTMHNGTQIGYWWGAEDGAAFGLAANKAYLAVPNTASVKSNLWFGKDATSISVPAVKAEDATIYNLAGQRVSATTKGIYIKNGKKLFVK